MKINKKTATILAFVLGALILATSAFADIMLGSGYYNLKNSLKTTMSELTNEVDSFSVELIASVKVDGNTFVESIDNSKYDIAAQAKETSGSYLNEGKVRENYSYNDKNQTIFKNYKDGSYEVIEKGKSSKDRGIFENPFEDEQVMDAEKIMDALVGSLENVIQIEESGNKKMYIGDIKDSEIPPLVNAISSFALKYSIFDENTAKRLDIPSPKSNVYVKEASGKAIENEDGILESGIFTASISAEDSKGIEHIYTVEFSIDIKDINSTVVKAPNLDGQKVTYSKDGFEFDSKHIGKYKNNIVIEEGNSFVKIGERILEITSVASGNVKGRYYEVYNEGLEPDLINEFDFTSNYDDSSFYITLNYTNNKGEKKKGVIHRSNLYDIYLDLDVTFNEDGNGYSSDNYDRNFNGEFVRVFE